MRRMLVVLLSACAAAVAAPAAGAAAPAWTTYRHDGARGGIDPDSSNPVTPTAAWQTPALDGKIYGQPLVYGSRVYVATENDTIYALDAATGAVAWSAHLATPENASTAPCGDISPTIGITSTPVIDPRTNRIYAVGAVATAAGPVHELFAVDLASGQAVAGFPVNADPPGANPAYQLQRPALALVNGRVLAGYGGNNGDCGTYWGWLVSLATAPPRGEASFQADPHSHGGAVWGSGTGPAVDAASHVWMTTGNGFGTSSFDFSESVVELDSLMHPLAYWAPTNWHTLDSSDTDLSSSQPVLLPHGLVLQSGKDGNAYVVNAASPGGVSSPVVSMHFCPGGSFGGSVYLAATSTIYAACSSGLKAMTLGLAAGTPTLALKPGFAAPGDAIGPPVIAGNLVWVVAWSSGRALGLDPTTGAVSFQAQLPAVEHFATPSAGGGRLFLGAGTQVLAFTIATPQPPLPPSGSPPPPPAPRLFRARLVPRRFRAGRSATLTLVLSRAATVTVTIDQLRRGQRPLRRLRRTFNAHAGRHSFRLRLGRLRPGSYRATTTAVAARPHSRLHSPAVSRSLVILGSTGSIGVQALDVVARADPDDLRVVALTARSDWRTLLEQAQTHGVERIALADRDAAARAAEAWTAGEVLAGPDGLVQLITDCGCDIVLNAIVGSAGLVPTVATLGEGIDLALANKESLVVGGELVTQLAQATGASIIPVDSEHSALHQLLAAERPGTVDKLILTASGGPFRGRSAAELEDVTVEQALAHPTWAMGGKITIDSATLMNKGLEVIEAHHLFGTPYDRIDVLVHPQSIIHSLISLCDGASLAHLGYPDMRVPISYALHYPERVDVPVAPLDLAAIGALTFEPVDEETFACLRLARQAAQAGGTAPCTLNAANEIAVHAFLGGRLRFLDIAAVIEETLSAVPAGRVHSFEALGETDARARDVAAELVAGRASRT